MGQYYLIVNVDKKEYLYAHRYDNGLKLMEFSWIGNNMVNAMMNLMYTRWRGDRVYVVGDYADLEDENEVWYPTLKELTEEFGIHDGDYKNHPDDYSLYGLADAKFKHLDPEYTDQNDNGLRYLYNHATKQVIDLKTCPECNWGGKAHPLTLLLAMGNGRGGGDYWTKSNQNLVGSWVAASNQIELAKEPIPDHDQYTVFEPGFKE